MPPPRQRGWIATLSGWIWALFWLVVIVGVVVYVLSTWGQE
ncbi:MAG TPA: hypothetical protein VMS98_03050 [Thermoanaerobaculia bacterium]|nr:hypothetical protein [Thermoanaerobaculia bacterium]